MKIYGTDVKQGEENCAKKMYIFRIRRVRKRGREIEKERERGRKREKEGVRRRRGRSYG